MGSMPVPRSARPWVLLLRGVRRVVPAAALLLVAGSLLAANPEGTYVADRSANGVAIRVTLELDLPMGDADLITGTMDFYDRSDPVPLAGIFTRTTGIATLEATQEMAGGESETHKLTARYDALRDLFEVTLEPDQMRWVAAHRPTQQPQLQLPSVPPAVAEQVDVPAVDVPASPGDAIRDEAARRAGPAAGVIDSLFGRASRPPKQLIMESARVEPAEGEAGQEFTLRFSYFLSEVPRSGVMVAESASLETADGMASTEKINTRDIRPGEGQVEMLADGRGRVNVVYALAPPRPGTYVWKIGIAAQDYTSPPLTTASFVVREKPGAPPLTAEPLPPREIWTRDPAIVSSNGQDGRIPLHLWGVSESSLSYRENLPTGECGNTLTWSPPPPELSSGDRVSLVIESTSNPCAEVSGSLVFGSAFRPLEGFSSAGSGPSGLHQAKSLVAFEPGDGREAFIRMRGGHGEAPDEWMTVTWRYGRKGTGAAPVAAAPASAAVSQVSPAQTPEISQAALPAQVPQVSAVQTPPASTRQGATTHVEKGMQLIGKTEAAAAQVEFETAVRLNPAYGDAWFGLGLSHLQQERWDRAAVAFRQAVRLLPDDADAHAYYASALLKLGRRDEALKEATAAKELGATGHPVLKDLGLEP